MGYTLDMENPESQRPSHNSKLGQEYIYNAAKAAAEKGDRLWQIDDTDKTLAAASTSETNEEVIVENLGSIVSGKGKELLKRIATYTASVGKILIVSATIDSEEYYQKIGFIHITGRSGMWSIDPVKLM
jgi:hypothetical protein